MADETEKSGAEEMGRPPLSQVAEEMHQQYHPSHEYYQQDEPQPAKAQAQPPTPPTKEK